MASDINKKDDDSATTISKWASYESYFFNQGANIAFIALMISFNLAMATWGVWEFTVPHWSTGSDILRITLPIARGAGRLVTWNVALLLFSGCKYWWTWIRAHTVIPLGFPVDNIMPHYHKILAWTIIINGCVIHTIPQIVNYATEALVIKKTDIWLFGGIATKQLLITGILLFFVFSMFFLTTLDRFRHTSVGFRVFWVAHAVGIFSAGPLLLIHGTIRGYPILTYMCGPPILLYILDCIMRRIYFASHNADLKELVAFDDGGEQVVKLVIRNPAFKYGPGQYAEIKVPQLSMSEWHPFTIASAPNAEGDVGFYIKAAGRWTKALFELAQKYNGVDASAAIDTISIRGPFGAPAQNYLSYSHIVVIGSGIGVTPLLSIWKHLSQQKVAETSNNNNKNSNMMTPSAFSSRDRQRVQESLLLEPPNVNRVDVVAFTKPLTNWRAQCAYYASVLESMTINVCLFCTSLGVETIVFCIWLYDLNRAAAWLQLFISLIALFVFGFKIMLSLMAYRARYIVSLVCFLEIGIFITDAMAYITSIMTLESPSRGKAIAYFTFFAAYLLLHGVRIFHIFYATARPPQQTVYDPKKAPAKRTEEAVVSITGIWVSRSYSAMNFAANDLVSTVHKLPKAFSLQLYATRDTAETVAKNTPFFDKDEESDEDNNNNVTKTSAQRHALNAGRPDWHSIFEAEINKAYNSTQQPVGVFFCGSPAIASTLQRVAQQVTAEHHYATNGKSQCRILVHKENF